MFQPQVYHLHRTQLGAYLEAGIKSRDGPNPKFRIESESARIASLAIGDTRIQYKYLPTRIQARYKRQETIRSRNQTGWLNLVNLPQYHFMLLIVQLLDHRTSYYVC